MTERLMTERIMRQTTNVNVGVEKWPKGSRYVRGVFQAKPESYYKSAGVQCREME